MGLFDHLIPETDAPVKITVRPSSQDMAPEGFASNPRGYSVGDVQAAVRGDMFNTPGMPIKYAAQPGQTFGRSATANAAPFDSIVAHHTGGSTLGSALETARKGDPFTGAKTGYHFLIDKDGTIVQGAPMSVRTNHVQPPTSPERIGRPDISNSNSVGISFVGDGVGPPTPEQMGAARNLSRSLMDRFGIQPQNVVGHGQIQNSRQGGEGMPLVNAIQGQPTVAQPPPSLLPQMGGPATAAPPSVPQRIRSVAPPAPSAAPKERGLFDHLIPASPVADRFADNIPGETPQLRSGLENRAQEMTRGEQTSPAANMAIDAGNQLSAASQGTTPHVDAYKGRLLSTEVHQDDAGNILFRDPQTGAMVKTDNAKHVALRDPNDNTVKVFARNEATNESPAVGVSRVLAPGLAAGAVTARPAIAAATNIAPKASDIFSTAKPYYREFTKEASKIEIPAQTATDLGGRIRGALDKANFIEELAPSVYKAVGILEKGEPLTVDALQNVKRVVGKSFNSPDKNVRDAAAVASSEIGKILSEVAPEAAKNLKTADAIHSTARSVQDLQRKSDVAGLRAGSGGYGGNAVNSMRQVLKPIVQKSIEGKITGFKPDEIQAMREIVEGTMGTNAARMAGQASPAKGLWQVPTTLAGAVTLGPAVLVLPALGMAGNKLATIMTGKQIDRLKELVAKRSPAYAEAISKATERFEQAQLAVVSNATPAKFAAYVSASRALSAGLTRDGIQITSGQLLKAIEGPVKSAAEGDEPAVPGRPGE